MIHIGIDTGVNTGIALWRDDINDFPIIKTVRIHQAMDIIIRLKENSPETITVYVEDARQRKWYGKEKNNLQGVGSIKRDAVIWEDFLADCGIAFKMIAPKNVKTKLSAESFKNLTGYAGKTSQHARDAAMIVFGK